MPPKKVLGRGRGRGRGRGAAVPADNQESGPPGPVSTTSKIEPNPKVSLNAPSSEEGSGDEFNDDDKDLRISLELSTSSFRERKGKSAEDIDLAKALNLSLSEPMIKFTMSAIQVSSREVEEEDAELKEALRRILFYILETSDNDKSDIEASACDKNSLKGDDDAVEDSGEFAIERNNGKLNENGNFKENSNSATDNCLEVSTTCETVIKSVNKEYNDSILICGKEVVTEEHVNLLLNDNEAGFKTEDSDKKHPRPCSSKGDIGEGSGNDSFSSAKEYAPTNKTSDINISLDVTKNKMDTNSKSNIDSRKILPSNGSTASDPFNSMCSVEEERPSLRDRLSKSESVLVDSESGNDSSESRYETPEPSILIKDSDMEALHVGNSIVISSETEPSILVVSDPENTMVIVEDIEEKPKVTN